MQPSQRFPELGSCRSAQLAALLFICTNTLWLQANFSGYPNLEARHTYAKCNCVKRGPTSEQVTQQCPESKRHFTPHHTPVKFTIQPNFDPSSLISRPCITTTPPACASMKYSQTPLSHLVASWVTTGRGSIQALHREIKLYSYRCRT